MFGCMEILDTNNHKMPNGILGLGANYTSTLFAWSQQLSIDQFFTICMGSKGGYL